MLAGIMSDILDLTPCNKPVLSSIVFHSVSHFPSLLKFLSVFFPLNLRFNFNPFLSSITNLQHSYYLKSVEHIKSLG